MRNLSLAFTIGFFVNSQNQSFIETVQPPDGSTSGITAGVAETALLDNKNPRINAIFRQVYT